VREDLLADAQTEGADSPPLVARIRQAMGDAGASGASVVVCTCSTIGGAAEDADLSGGATSIRIDRAMADEAVRRGGKVLLVAALQSTVAPTVALLRSSADRLSVYIEIDPLVVADAWPHFKAGRHGDYAAAIVDAIVRADAKAEAIVLAQASMAPAAERLAAQGIIALTSPRLGVAHALALHRQGNT
jgi:hypothetical protein